VFGLGKILLTQIDNRLLGVEGRAGSVRT
jgi:hypothetical protein